MPPGDDSRDCYDEVPGKSFEWKGEHVMGEGILKKNRSGIGKQVDEFLDRVPASLYP
jgi:hypothetical protein